MCQDCVTGTLRGDLTPAGVEEVVHNVPTYVTHPDPGIKPLGTVVILPDAFGWTLRNTRVLADAYAKRVPCTVYVPEFMNGTDTPILLRPVGLGPGTVSLPRLLTPSSCLEH